MTAENTQNPVNVSAKAPRPTKKAWEFPISKAYYEKVRVRGEKIMDELGYGVEWMKYLMPHIDRYLLTGERLGNHYAYECMLIVFTCLRFDLDLAIERSAKAKARAAERRALKEAQRAEEAQTAEDARKNEEKRKIEKDTVAERKEKSSKTQMQEVAAYPSTTTREGDGEFKTAGREVADSDGTAVEEDGIFHNREAKSCSSGHSRTSFVDTVEPFEEVGEVFCRNTTSIVSKGDDNLAIFAGSGRVDGYLISSAVGDGIVNKIPEHRFEQGLIAGHRERMNDIVDNGNTAPGSYGIRVLHNFTDDVGQVKGFLGD